MTMTTAGRVTVTTSATAGRPPARADEPAGDATHTAERPGTSPTVQKQTPGHHPHGSHHINTKQSRYHQKTTPRLLHPPGHHPRKGVGGYRKPIPRKDRWPGFALASQVGLFLRIRV